MTHHDSHQKDQFQAIHLVKKSDQTNFGDYELFRFGRNTGSDESVDFREAEVGQFIDLCHGRFNAMRADLCPRIFRCQEVLCH